ncbi:hypothetical protein F895_03717 [Acinetobacter sp. CIP 64.2]|jgi:hypothetical protein|uniref:Uncharacterized protein n=1 Tax=Acinetobacter higginsii TaxID=70347 RepID=N9R4D7_9GAMM|nr:hypothetical protein F972_00004 [Acinetobacter sp. CIP 102529]ENX11685.1 hypothetical protein F895_03717 [Acinetobacter sp. CIP 64.2]ENX52934.1 hypothetical protein F902_04197 [Acinetobacter higginsii]ESK34923.1 hypothetical protein F987_04416 [Acinetobacter gyllenbergii NIPH 230]QDX16361.1 hypothetical protein C6W84_16993 [Acinetobacter baumannii]
MNFLTVRFLADFSILAIVNLCEIYYFKNKVAYRTYA